MRAGVDEGGSMECLGVAGRCKGCDEVFKCSEDRFGGLLVEDGMGSGGPASISGMEQSFNVDLKSPSKITE